MKWHKPGRITCTKASQSGHSAHMKTQPPMHDRKTNMDGRTDGKWQPDELINYPSAPSTQHGLDANLARLAVILVCVSVARLDGPPDQRPHLRDVLAGQLELLQQLLWRVGRYQVHVECLVGTVPRHADGGPAGQSAAAGGPPHVGVLLLDPVLKVERQPVDLVAGQQGEHITVFLHALGHVDVHRPRRTLARPMSTTLPLSAATRPPLLRHQLAMEGEGRHDGHLEGAHIHRLRGLEVPPPEGTSAVIGRKPDGVSHLALLPEDLWPLSWVAAVLFARLKHLSRHGRQVG
mmetsp:Transcript_32922/g.81530  ORF Transcript_32922/g.81530 Transcript_32922/m.81530 type:complete len:291 (-) Transcript_32922:555-1427(-)